MLIGLLRSKTIFGLLLAYLLSLVVLVFQFFVGQPKGGPNELLFSHWAFSWLETNSSVVPLICLVLAITLVVFSRLRFREVKSTLANVNLSMVALASVLAAQSRQLFSRPDVMVCTLILMGLFAVLFSTYKRDSVLSEMFHVGLLLGFATLFVGQSIMLMLPVTFSVLMLRTGSWKEWIVFLLGILMTVVFVALVLVWHESPFLDFQRMIQTSWVGSLGSSRTTVGHIVLMGLVVFSTSSVLRDLTAGTIHERNISLVNVAWVTGVLLMVLLFGLGWQIGFVLAAFPLSTFISRSIEQIKRWWLADMLLLMLIAAPFLSNLSLF